MGFSFPTRLIGELAASGILQLQTGPFGSQLHKEDYVASGTPVISTEAIGRGRIRAEIELPMVSSGKAAELARHRLQAGDILFARRGIQATGLAARIDGPFDGALCGTGAILLRADPESIDSRFLIAFLATDEAFNWLRANAVGAVMPNLNTGIISGLAIPMPAMHVQRELGRFVSALDDRIDNLRATNATLEAIAQALFKSWFVDFDPVHAKAEGRAPAGMDSATAAPFPSAFEDSELGPIPKGWTVATLAEHVDADRGLSYKGAGLAEPSNGLPMHNLNSVLEGGGYKYAGIKYYTGPYKDKHLVQAGDIIVANTEQGHEYRLIGFPAVVPALYPTALFSHHLYRVRAKTSSPITKEWLYQCLMVPAVRDQIVSFANGSTVNMLKVVGLEIPRFVLPPRSACQAFEDLVQPMRQQFEANVERTDTLASLRDTLLPRLISGKLRLPEARSIAEAVA